MISNTTHFFYFAIAIIGDEIRMASTSIGVQIIDEKSIISEMLEVILEKLGDEDRKRMNPWIHDIEEYSEQLVLGLKQKKISKRRPEILAAAAIYDAFLEYESRTTVKFGLPLMKEMFGFAPCSINSAWTQLFDSRALLRKDYLNPVYSNKSLSQKDAVFAVVNNINRAIIGTNTDVEKWITNIRSLACQLLERIDSSNAAGYDCVLVATAAIYAAIRRYTGKPRIQISQRDLAQFCNHSPAMLSKVWLELFG
jgi:hypothetical protein